MKAAGHVEVAAAKVARYETKYSLCIICQTNTGEGLVEKPSTHDKLLKFIRERASYGDKDYPDVSRHLGNVTSQDLESRSATWHRKCYQDTVHKGMCSRAKERYEQRRAAKGIRQEPSSSHSSSSGTLTRSQSTPYNKDLCFFCENGASYKNPLHTVATENAGLSLKEAIEKSGNEKLHVKLCTSINPEDAHAIDIKYHKRCWAVHVTNVRRKAMNPTQSEPSVADEVAAEVEFLSLVEGTLLDGNVVSMSVLQEAYIAILSANNVVNPKCSRKKLKQLMQTEIPNIEFHKPKRVNEAERISIKSTRDAAIQLVEETSVNSDMDMKVLYNAASVLRKAISKAKKWIFGGSLRDVTDEHLPKELYCFYRWVLQGSNTTLSTDKKSSQVNKHAVNLAHTTVTMFVSEQQVRNKKSLSLRSTREMPQQLAVGIAIRQATRSKKLISILHGFGMSVEYNRLLRVEGQLATSVLQRMLVNDNIYLPPDVVLGRHVFFAVDNVDFAEDTPDGKRTLHATAMAIYQRCQPEDEVAKLQLTDAALRRSMKDLPGTVTTLLDCPKPTVKPPSPVYASFSLKDVQPPSDVCLPDVAWLMGRTLVRSQKNGSQMPVMEDDDVSSSG